LTGVGTGGDIQEESKSTARGGGGGAERAPTITRGGASHAAEPKRSEKSLKNLGGERSTS